MRKLTCLLMFIAVGVIAQVPDVKFTDLNGKSYSLHALLEKGKHVVIHTQFNS